MKKISDFFEANVERDFLFRAPACFIHEGKRWDYIVNSGHDHTKSFIKKLESSKIFRIKFIEKSGVWAVRYRRY